MNAVLNRFLFLCVQRCTKHGLQTHCLNNFQLCIRYYATYCCTTLRTVIQKMYSGSYLDFPHAKLSVHGQRRLNQQRDFCVIIYIRTHRPPGSLRKVHHKPLPMQMQILTGNFKFTVIQSLVQQRSRHLL
jgi:hypothetical protein